ncbi:transcription intermediary factor 1-beta-like [Mytilus californianus]|uniref:transcription intermediary factor 1-beta-like n=1 Tax=Mytilus californianus TaxID=6549 RepID=UPI0022471B8B|nr:transcription intermediary factor 1-beta-like [Mytilus californianus]
MAQCPIKSCEICGSSPGSRFCVDCEQYFCNICEISHLKTKPCKHHVFQHAHTINPEEKTPVCEKHNERFLYFCNTCSCLLCSICLTSSHKTHDFCLLDEAGSQKRSEFNTKVKSFETDIHKAEKKVDVLRNSLEQFKDATEIAKKKIDEKRKSLIDVINNISDGYLKEIEEKKLKETLRIQQEINKRRNEIIKNKESINNVKTSVSKQNNTIFLVSVIEVNKNMPSLKSMEDVTELPTKINFDPAKTMEDEIGKTIGVLTLSAGAIMNLCNAPITIGSLVRLKTATHSKYRHGVDRGSVGSVKCVYFDESVLVSFPEKENWSGMLVHIEHV